MKFDSVTNLPRAWGHPIASAQFKSSPKDFIVREALEFDFDNEGEHLYLHIRKCNLNTADVQEILQQQFKCSSVDIGVSGLKDKVGITDQWFSVRTNLSLADTALNSMAVEDTQSAPLNEFVVLDTARHSRKLRRGAHRHNSFSITLRDVQSDSGDDTQVLINSRLESIKEHGFVNYFGPQRFGIDQQNLVKAARYFSNTKRKISRVQRGLLISSARSCLFNLVCAQRVANGTWNKPMSGEPMLLDGTHSFFINDAAAVETESRCSTGDVHPSGPMWGEGDPLASSDCAMLENAVVNDHSSFAKGLAAEGLKQQRRALRASAEQLQWDWTDDAELSLNFNLLKGVYATSLLAELVTLNSVSRV